MDNNFLIQLMTRLDASQTTTDINKIEQQLNKRGIKLKTALDTTANKLEIENLARNLQQILSKTKGFENITVQQLVSSINEAAVAQKKLNAEQKKAVIAEQSKYYGRIKSELNNLYSLKTKLLSADELQTAELKKQIKQTQERIRYNKNQLESKGLSNSNLNAEIKSLEDANQKQLSLSKARMQDVANTKAQDQAQKEYNATLKELQSVQLQIDNIYSLTKGGVKNDYSTQIAKLQGNFRSLGLTEDEIKQKTHNVTNALEKLNLILNKPVEDTKYHEIISANDLLQQELANTSNEYTKLQASFRGFVNEHQRLSLANTIEAWNQKNSAASKDVIKQNEAYIASLRELDTQMDRMSFNKIKDGFKQAENSMRGLGKLGASVRQQFKQAYQSFTMWLSASTLVMKVISETRQAFTELKEINTLLTEISKANESLSKSDLMEIGSNSFDVASKYGKTATDYLSGVQEASRAGYKNAEAMAELSTAAQGAGDMTADIANQMIIATDKAYKLNGSIQSLSKVLDGVNYITNHNAVNMTELSEGMTIVGSTASSFGVGVNELTAALGTMAATTQQSGSEVARAFRAILLNIRQVSDEEEGIDAEGLTKYENACNALGVSLKETKNGVLQTRDAMEVLKELSVEYNKLSEDDLRRTQLLNSVGGKLRATQLDALLRQWGMYESMLQQFEDGNGSMQREAEKTANSWAGVSNKIANTWTDTVENIANSDAIITILNGVNSLLSGINKLTDALGSLGSIGLGVGLFAGFKNVGIGMLVAY